jgi:abortive infection bacteriophage resistance protein
MHTLAGFFGLKMTYYDKPALTSVEQVRKLQDRVLKISDKRMASRCLSKISYYRLSAYTRTFYLPNCEDHIFKSETKFEEILNLYYFDRELRLLLLDAIESLEFAKSC